jgi:hypothetical protein
MSVRIAVGVIVALTIVLAVVLYRSSTKFPISGLQVQSDGSLNIIVNSLDDYSKLLGKRLAVHTKSLGNIYTSVCTVRTSTNGAIPVTLTMIATPSGSYASGANYKFDSGDYAVATPMW